MKCKPESKKVQKQEMTALKKASKSLPKHEKAEHKAMKKKK